MNTVQYSTRIGRINITEENGFIVSIDLSEKEDIHNGMETPCLREAYEQLRQYLDGNRKSFDFPVCERGTDFQKKVWAILRDIPYGETQSYRDIAKAAGNERAYRAVGGACNKNPLLLYTPCHRVVGSGGSLTGFAAGLDIKKKLLDFEKNS